MYSDIATAQVNMLEALEAVYGVIAAAPQSIVIQMFVNAKSDEIIEIFKGADRTSKGKVMNIMRKLDGANANKYNVLRS